MGDSAFNRDFDFISRAVCDRLRRYDSATACGRWNAALFDDFRSDSVFLRAADEVFCEAVSRHTHRQCTVSDGLSLEAVTIDLGVSIELFFRLHFLDGPRGFGIAPAKFGVAADATRDGGWCSTLCCGLREPDGDFWYPTAKLAVSVVMPDDYDWAYSRAHDWVCRF